MKASSEPAAAPPDESTTILKELEVGARAVNEQVHELDWQRVQALQASLQPDIEQLRAALGEIKQLDGEQRPYLARLRVMLGEEALDRVSGVARLRVRALGHVNDIISMFSDNVTAAARLIERVEACTPSLAGQGRNLEVVWRRQLQELAGTVRGIRHVRAQLDAVMADLRTRLAASRVTETTVLAGGPEKPAPGLVVRRPASASWPDRDLPPAA